MFNESIFLTFEREEPPCTEVLCRLKHKLHQMKTSVWIKPCIAQEGI